MEAASAVREETRFGGSTARQGVALAVGFPPIRYEVCGLESGPAIVVLGGISASRHVAANNLDQNPGWWDAVVGTGRAVDTHRFRVIGIDYVTSLRGTTDLDPLPTVTTFHQAQAVCAVLDALEVETAHAVVGASYGGMVALAFAARHAPRVRRIVVIGAAHESDPFTTTLRAIQRRIVALGETAGVPADGVALARALAMTTYKTRAEFASRFAMTPAFRDDGVRFPAEEYVIARGRDYAARTTAEDFRALTLSLDLHSVTPEDITVPATLIGVKEDLLVPIDKIRELAARLGATANLIELSSAHGHDSFLNDSAQMTSFIADAVGEQ